MSKLSRRTLSQGSALAPALALSGRSGQDEIELPGKTKNTKFAVNVEMWFRDRPFLDRIRAAADLGFPAVEFWPWRGKDLDAIAKLTDELGLEIAQFTAWGFSPGLNDPANHAAFLEEIEASCKTANALGVEKATVVGGNDIAGVRQGAMHAAITAGLTRAAPIAEAHDVMLILEPMNVRVDHKGHCLYGSPEAVGICRAVGSPYCKILDDLYHQQITEGNLIPNIDKAWSEIAYFQVGDNPGRREPGTGEINFRNVFRHIHAKGFDGLVGMEHGKSQGGKEGELKLIQAYRDADEF